MTADELRNYAGMISRALQGTLINKIEKGGAGSGNFGHAGRQGERGGSSSDGGSGAQEGEFRSSRTSIVGEHTIREVKGPNGEPRYVVAYKPSEMFRTKDNERPLGVHNSLGAAEQRVQDHKDSLIAEHNAQAREGRGTPAHETENAKYHILDRRDGTLGVVITPKGWAGNESMLMNVSTGYRTQSEAMQAIKEHAKKIEHYGKAEKVIKGGQGSGNFGHAGRQGERGGSSSSEGGKDVVGERQSELYTVASKHGWDVKRLSDAEMNREGYGTSTPMLRVFNSETGRSFDISQNDSSDLEAGIRAIKDPSGLNPPKAQGKTPSNPDSKENQQRDEIHSEEARAAARQAAADEENAQFRAYVGMYMGTASGDMSKYITHSNGKWSVHSESGKHMGTYDSEAGAKHRLQQIEYFKHVKKMIDAVRDSIKSIGQGG